MTLNINWSIDSTPSCVYSRTFWFPDSDGQKIMDILNKYESMEIRLNEKTVQSLFDKQKNKQTHNGSRQGRK